MHMSPSGGSATACVHDVPRIVRALVFVSCLALFSVTVALASPNDGHGSQVAKTKALTARLTYKKADDLYSDMRVTITRTGGASVTFRLRPDGPLAPHAPGHWQPGSRSIYIRNLDASREPEVVVDLFTGGAHCCYYSIVFRYVPAIRRYVRVSHLWGDDLPLLKDLNGDGTPEFISGDFEFDYAFTDYVNTVEPIQIWRFVSGRFRVVSRDFPNEIRRSSNNHWADYRQLLAGGGTARGALAAYLAEKYLLGEEAQGWTALRSVAARGDLALRIGDSPRDSANVYLANLRTFLVKHGYAR